MKKLAITTAETAHWHAMLGRAEYLVQRCLPADVTDYLVGLFLRQELDTDYFGPADKNEGNNNPLTANVRLQQLADKCLLICGFYPDLSQLYGIELQDFYDMGRDAYKKIASHADLDESGTYIYLSENFNAVVEMLLRIHHLTCSNMVAKDDRNILPGNGNQHLPDSFFMRDGQAGRYLN